MGQEPPAREPGIGIDINVRRQNIASILPTGRGKLVLASKDVAAGHSEALCSAAASTVVVYASYKNGTAEPKHMIGSGYVLASSTIGGVVVLADWCTRCAAAPQTRCPRYRRLFRPQHTTMVVSVSMIARAMLPCVCVETVVCNATCKLLREYTCRACCGRVDQSARPPCARP